jgi:hypothetical protein
VLCEGTVFAVTVTAVDGDQYAIGLRVMPQMTERVYDLSHGDDTAPGMTGRALARIAVELAGGNYPPDVAQLIRDPATQLVGIGFAAEAWATQRPPTERGPSGFIADEPDRVEVRMITLVDVAGAEFAHVRRRGHAPEQGMWPPPTPGDRERFSGPVPQALHALIAVLLRPATTTGN